MAIINLVCAIGAVVVAAVSGVSTLGIAAIALLCFMAVQR